ncbi:MAG TPA: bifunctional class I SAM-dependent methyltransferase/glycosyltransferase family 2 protein [Acidimicrobiia bacterium]|nr:bifunctional class I SAM-dependent methyltransferase/glycosyltransferase family 2 protein [Acidimicrobiia bacterium]
MTSEQAPSRSDSTRKRQILALTEQYAPERERWIAQNRFFYEEDERYLRFLIPPGQRILDLGCGTGHLLAALQPSHGVGVDFSPAMIEEARELHPELELHVGDIEVPETIDALDGPFDVILLSDTIGSLEDVQATLDGLHRLCHRETRLVIVYYSNLWAPVLRFAQLIGQQMPQAEQNWLSGRDLADILRLVDFDTVRVDSRQIVPKALGGFGGWANRVVGTLPGFRAAALRSYVVARSMRVPTDAHPSATVVVPCRNEAGNVAAAVERIPRFCDDLEILFVEGHSRDDTLTAIKQVVADHPDLDIKFTTQDGTGKGDAVRKGFDLARGEVLMILDADLTTPPEDLPKFYEALTTGKGEFVMGTRLVYPMEIDAMRSLNVLGNKAFSMLFTWLLNQRITDTLCGTKVLSREHYEQIRAGRSYFGDFDPFGDFDLIFGAARLNLKIVEVPVRYRARTYGTTQISRFRHGMLLLRMVGVAYRKLKAF